MAAATSQTITFTVNYTDASGAAQSAKATTTFTATAPTSVSLSTRLGQWEVENSSSGPELAFGLPIDPSQGIKFTAQATSPSGNAGTYEWAQLVTTNTVNRTLGSTTTPCNGPTGLDTQFPVDTGLSTQDSPAVFLQSAYNKETWNLGFTMYFMWTRGQTTDIPVPLGYVTWSAFGDATQASGNWTIQPDSTEGSNSLVQTFVYPTWTTKAVRGTYPCQ